MRVVIDTNVVVAGLVSQGLCHELVETHLPDHQPVLSRRMWDELLEKLREEFGLDPGDLPLLALYRRHAVWVEPRPLEAPACRDPDDDRVLATSLAGEAEAIVTGDDDLLTLGAFRGISILSPRQFVERVVRSR